MEQRFLGQQRHNALVDGLCTAEVVDGHQPADGVIRSKVGLDRNVWVVAPDEVTLVKDRYVMSQTDQIYFCANQA